MAPVETRYPQALAYMEGSVHMLASRLPPPQKVQHLDGFVFRYVEQTIHQALIQKLARIVTGLRAAWLLLEHGLVQEQGAMQRILDELQEDVSFLSIAAIKGEPDELTQAFLNAFYEEEFDQDTALASTQSRPSIPRRKIRAHIANSEAATLDPSTGIELARTVSKAYSGYVHAASPQIMDMYGGDPPHFHLQGMRGTPREEDHRQDLWNYFYRGILAFGFSAKAFGDEALFSEIKAFSKEFAKEAGKDYDDGT